MTNPFRDVVFHLLFDSTREDLIFTRQTKQVTPLDLYLTLFKEKYIRLNDDDFCLYDDCPAAEKQRRLWLSSLVIPSVSAVTPLTESPIPFANITTPSWNSQSCFCDSVLVTMFASTRKFDVIMSPVAETVNMKLDNHIDTLGTYMTPDDPIYRILKHENASASEAAIKASLVVVKNSMRSVSSKEMKDRLQLAIHDVRSHVADSTQNAISSSGASDAAEFFSILIRVTNFQNWFIPIFFCEETYELQYLEKPFIRSYAQQELITLYISDERDSATVPLADAIENTFSSILKPEKYVPNDINEYFQKEFWIPSIQRPWNSVIVSARSRCRLLTAPYIMFMKVQRFHLETLRNTECRLAVSQNEVITINTVYDGRQQYRLIGVVTVTSSYHKDPLGKITVGAHYDCFFHSNSTWQYFNGLGGDASPILDWKKATTHSNLLLFSRI